MAETTSLGRMSSGLTALRGVLLLVVGLVALIAPAPTLVSLVWLGGALFLVDGLLGLWSLTFGNGKTGNYWFDIARNVLAVILGVLLLISFMAGLAFVTFLVYLAAFQALLVGIMEVALVLRARQMFSVVWPVLLSGVLYILFGLMLLFQPVVGALAGVMLGGILAILFAMGLFGLAWRLRKAGL